MILTTDTKIGLGVIIATVLIIGGGAWYASRSASVGTTSEQTVSDPSRLVRDDDPTLGAGADAAVTVVEFGDFECPACGALHYPLKTIKEEYAGKSVRFVYRQFPLAQHTHAALAAQASLSAAAQGKFWEYHNLLFENQQQLERTHLEGYAQQLGLNLDQFRQDLDTNAYEDLIQQDIADGRALGINSTPTVFVNGKQYSGAFTVQALRSVIDAELQ